MNIDDGSQHPEGHLSADGHLVARGGGWQETDFGQVERWRNQAPDLYEAFMVQTERLKAAEARVETLTATLNEIARLRLATDEGSLRVRADRMWELASGKRMIGYADALQGAAPPSQGWQDISTAPKDGTWIAVASTHNRYYRGAVRFEDGQWRRDDDEPDTLFEHAATHWMPLPVPPLPEGRS